MAKSATSQLLLFPAGRSEWDDQLRLQGATSLALTDRTRAATAQLLSAWYESDEASSSPDLDLILTSNEEGSLETAEMLAALTGAKVKPLACLKEPAMGLWEGQTESELTDRHGKAFRQWRETPASVNPPEGESLLDTKARTLAALLKVLEKNSKKRIAIVLRPLQFQLLSAILLGDSPSQLWPPSQDHQPKPIAYHDVEPLRQALLDLKAGV